jgi:putative ABC transport system permease protein
MGMKKPKVALGLLCEMVAITAVCLILGLGAGTLTAQPVADIILTQQIEAAESAAQNPAQSGGMMVMSEAVTTAAPQGLSEIDVRLSGGTMVQIALIALLLAVVSSAVGIGKIVKY